MMPGAPPVAPSALKDASQASHGTQLDEDLEGEELAPLPPVEPPGIHATGSHNGQESQVAAVKVALAPLSAAALDSGAHQEYSKESPHMHATRAHNAPDNHPHSMETASIHAARSDEEQDNRVAAVGVQPSLSNAPGMNASPPDGAGRSCVNASEENGEDMQLSPLSMAWTGCRNSAQLCGVEFACLPSPAPAMTEAIGMGSPCHHEAPPVVEVARQSIQLTPESLPLPGESQWPESQEVPIPRWTAEVTPPAKGIGQSPSPSLVMRSAILEVARPIRRRLTRKTPDSKEATMPRGLTRSQEESLFTDVFAQADQAPTPARRSSPSASADAGASAIAIASAGASASASASASTSAPELSPSAAGHTLRPAQQGMRVAVIGDGWGSGSGGYEAIITEADSHTYTLVSLFGPMAWKETHVLKQYTIPLSHSANAPKGPKHKRSLSMARDSASPKQKCQNKRNRNIKGV